MYIRRKFDDALIAWKKDALHKPLLLRGARQTGKTTAVRELAQSFDHYIEINFEKHPELCSLFEGKDWGQAPIAGGLFCASVMIWLVNILRFRGKWHHDRFVQ